MAGWQAWRREPLAHFLIAGAAIYGVSLWRGDPVDSSDRAIVITAAKVAQLAATWEMTWRRTPTPAEIDALIRDYIREEIYYREAKRLGIDQDDPMIRRRLRAKMEYLATAQLEAATPDDATLQRWLDRDLARYARAASYSFDQIYLGQSDADAANERAKTVRAALAAGASPERLGTRTALPHRVTDRDRAAISAQFGAPFAATLAQQPRGRWAGPVASGFGYHLVRVTAITVPDPPKLDEVRAAVANDWRVGTRKAREAKAYQLLLDSYTVRIARP